MNFIIPQCLKLNLNTKAYGPKEKLKKVLKDAITELQNKHNISVLVDLHYATGRNAINMDSIEFKENATKKTNNEKRDCEENQAIVCKSDDNIRNVHDIPNDITLSDHAMDSNIKEEIDSKVKGEIRKGKKDKKTEDLNEITKLYMDIDDTRTNETSSVKGTNKIDTVTENET